ncbi:hypothetical protein MAHJHV65_20000 [Mycobacterium avium subsp. hominissuis]
MSHHYVSAVAAESSTTAKVASAADAGWALVQQMLRDVTEMVRADAETEGELREGLRVIARVLALCSQISVEADPDAPAFTDMCAPMRMVGGPNPDGNYYLAMIRGDRTYRVRGNRGTSSYLGIQVLAGTGLSPRRMDRFVSDTGLQIASDGTFELVFSASKPHAQALGDAQWVSLPEDASALVVRDYIGDFATQQSATLTIDVLDGDPPHRVTDAELGEQFTSLAWTLLKLCSLHRTVKPELLIAPNQLHTAEAAALGSENTTPDNLYMIGTFRLEPDQALILDIDPPDTRYWSITLENIWHECIEPRQRHSSVTNLGVTPAADGRVRIAISEHDLRQGHWLDTGGRHRGFVVLRWLDNPNPPGVLVSVHTEDGA